MLEKLGLVDIGWTFAFTLLNALIMYVVFKKLLYQPVKRMIEKRQQDIQREITQAEESNRQAQQYRDDYLEKLKTAEQEGRAIVDRATVHANGKAQRIIQTAEQDAQRIREHAQRDLELERKRAANELKGQVSSLAILAASKVLENEIDQKENERLVDRFLEEVKEVTWQN